MRRDACRVGREVSDANVSAGLVRGCSGAGHHCAAARIERCRPAAGAARFAAASGQYRAAALRRHLSRAGSTGRRARSAARRGCRMAGCSLRVSRASLSRGGADSAAGHAGIRDGLCLYRLSRYQWQPADLAACGHGLAGRRLLVSAGPIASGCGALPGACALSLCLHAGEKCLCRAKRVAVRCGAVAGPVCTRSLVACQLAGGTARGGGRARAGDDGDAGRLRHGLVFRGRYLLGRHLSGVAGLRRSHRSGAIVLAAGGGRPAAGLG